MATDNPVVDLALQYRAAVLKRDAEALKRLARAYNTIWTRIKFDMENLINAINAADEMTAAQITRLAQYKTLIADIEREVNQFASYLSIEMRNEAGELIREATMHARGMAGAVAPGLTATWQTLQPAQIETLLGFLAPESRIFSWWSAQAGKETAQSAANLIIEMIGAGKNPLTYAPALRRVLGVNLTSAMKTARTVQLWTYREASRANYLANRNVVRQWQWVAKLDDSTCAACVALHGTKFDLEVPSDAHWNCRCVVVPVTDFTDDIEGGQAWFEKQDEATQKAILGAGKYEAWKENPDIFSRLAQHKEDATFGMMWTETPLKDLAGDE